VHARGCLEKHNVVESEGFGTKYFKINPILQQKQGALQFFFALREYFFTIFVCVFCVALGADV
jgi:hypothetical protein